MLQLFTSMKELNMRQLLRVHSESIYANCGTENLRQLQAEQEFFDYLHEFFYHYDGIYALWVTKGNYCSALRLEPYQDGLLLSGLETAPAVRGRGYATLLVQAVLSYLPDSGYRKLYSHVDKNHSASLKVHTNCGFQRILEHAVFLDGSVYQSSCTFCYEL